jgi:hypothetical protein
MVRAVKRTYYACVHLSRKHVLRIRTATVEVAPQRKSRAQQ